MSKPSFYLMSQTLPHKHPTRICLSSVLSIIAVMTLMISTPHQVGATPKTRVTLNGKSAPVFFNDGDSFRVLAGSLKGSKARLAGFNTLESYGAVHSWGSWTKKELYALAKMGTYNAREGIWECTSDLSKDTYGRYLWVCPDLVVDQIKKGYAHAMSVTSAPAKPAAVAAQRDAVKNKRGIWAHGVPEYVLTSIHSATERSDDRPSYNRLVSSVDGHSLKWKHRDTYEECYDVCWKPSKADRYQRFAQRWSKHAEVSSWIEAYDDDARLKLATALLDKADTEKLWREPSHKKAGLSAFEEMRSAGWVDAAHSDIETCMLYVDFRRRFGASRAVCLK